MLTILELKQGDGVWASWTFNQKSITKPSIEFKITRIKEYKLPSTSHEVIHEHMEHMACPIFRLN